MEKHKLSQTETWFKLVLLVFFAGLYLLALPYPKKSKEFPHLISILSVGLLVISLIRDFTRKTMVSRELGDVGEPELTTVDTATRRFRKRRFYKAWGILLVSAFVGLMIGFLFTAMLLFLGCAFVFGKRADLKKNIIISLLITAVIFVIFQGLMDVPLLEGLIRIKF